MRDVLLGLLTYVLAIVALVSVIVLCMWLYGPPTADRERSFAFIGGGGLLLIALLLLSLAGLIAYSNMPTHD